MELTVVLHSHEAQRLISSILTGEEYDALLVQLKKIQRIRHPPGRAELRIHGHRRFLIIFIYTSLVLETVYLLSYHLERRGEPTAAQVEAVNRYVLEIQAQELEGNDHANGK